MLYYLAEFINKRFNPPGFDIFRYITWRSALAAITAMLISFWIGPKIIRKLNRDKIADEIRTDGPKEHLVKAGTPTMGGVIILLSVLLPVIFWADIKNIYVLLILLSTIWMGIVGFIDDYLKVFKKLKRGLVAKYKLMNQIALGIVISCLIYFLPEFKDINSITTIPFLKNFNFDFSYFYIPIMIFIITATSNAVNLTDGLDGLAIGCTGIAGLVLAVISYVSGNEIFNYVRYKNEQLTGLENQSQNVLNRWQYDGQITNVPRALWNDLVGNSAFSTRWIEDGSYFRLKNIYLSYKIPEQFLVFKNAEFYISATNIFTLDKYLGYDPEFAFSHLQMLQGIDYGLTPQTRQFIAGIKIGL